MFNNNGAKSMGRQKSLLNSDLIQLVESDLSEINDSDAVIKLTAIRAAYYHKESDVASIFNIARSTLERWIANYKNLGFDGLKNKSRGHNPSKLSEKEKNKIKEWVLAGKDSTGNQVHWTLKRLIKEISLVFSKEITKTPLWLTLISLNLRVVLITHFLKRDSIFKMIFKNFTLYLISF
jgi:transposase